MKKIVILFFIFLPLIMPAQESATRKIIDLNGTWQFDQTIQAFPPKKFTRTIPVPGLVHLANPKIEDYEKFFKHEDKVQLKEQHNLYHIDYIPQYSWYRKSVFIPDELKDKEGVITIKKSQYVTQVYINGMDMGTSMACYTPVEFPVTRALKYGQENEILIKVGDRVWLPSEAAGGTDKEKEHYLPGIWDDVLLSFSGKLRIDRLLPLPSVKNKQVTVKMQVRNFNPSQIFFGDPMEDTCLVRVTVSDIKTGKKLGETSTTSVVRRDNLNELVVNIGLNEFPLWTPDHPNLCTAEVELLSKGRISDKISRKFGMRDFTRKGKFFYLNEEKTILRGTNVTLQRFFEDPDCGNLVWDKEWVRKFLIDIPKGLNWNSMRICVGIVPDFWYDLADEYGLMFQNEWLYWQNHGWPAQIKKEYTDWVWSDGAHPSIVIWDGINENYDNYIGNVLIPELMKLDPTRIWDAGFMTGDHMTLDEMDEPHPYEGYLPWKNKENYEKAPYPLGNLDYRNQLNLESMGSSAAQLVNEYGWVWLLRNGNPAKLTVDLYNYYLGKNSTPEQNREFQAYWLQLETEWLRSQPYHAGVLAFCYLTNNYGYTGDWFINHIKDLEPAPALRWFKHAFAPQAVFINLTDGRFIKQQKPYLPGSMLSFTLYGINDKGRPVNGELELLIYDENGRVKQLDQKTVSIPATGNKNIPACITLPEKPGGYLLLARFKPEGGEEVISRRYIKVGEAAEYRFFEMNVLY
jgi:hypothetical protein